MGRSIEGEGSSAGGTSRQGLFVVVRLCEVSLIGEKGSRVPNAAIAEISVEIELALTLSLAYDRYMQPQSLHGLQDC